MTDVRLVPVEQAHLEQLALRMRPEDLLEVLSSGHTSALEALATSVADSEAATLLFNGEVAVVFGVAELEASRGRAGVVWCLTSTVVDRHRLSFHRAAKSLLRDMLELRWPELLTFIDCRYQAALDWVQVLGGRLGEVKPHPRSGLPFQVVSFGGA